MKKFNFIPSKIPEVMIIEYKKLEDERGFFAETYNNKEFIEAGITEEFLQDNHSFSKKNIKFR